MILEKLGYEYNQKGYKIAKGDKAGVILGDSVTPRVIQEVMSYLMENKISASMVNFGMGGALMTGDKTRDTYGFTMKCSAVCRDGSWYECFKMPKGSAFKTSLGGMFHVVKDMGFYHTTVNHTDEECDELQTVFKNGVIVRNETLTNIRNRLSSEIILGMSRTDKEAREVPTEVAQPC